MANYNPVQPQNQQYNQQPLTFEGCININSNVVVEFMLTFRQGLEEGARAPRAPWLDPPLQVHPPVFSGPANLPQVHPPVFSGPANLPQVHPPDFGGPAIQPQVDPDVFIAPKDLNEEEREEEVQVQKKRSRFLADSSLEGKVVKTLPGIGITYSGRMAEKPTNITMASQVLAQFQVLGMNQQQCIDWLVNTFCMKKRYAILCTECIFTWYNMYGRQQ